MIASAIPFGFGKHKSGELTRLATRGEVKGMTRILMFYGESPARRNSGISEGIGGKSEVCGVQTIRNLQREKGSCPCVRVRPFVNSVFRPLPQIGNY